ncbi:MAG: hypothetical protein WC442_05745 [Candidatus Omnitrophota bacterium]
MFKKRIQKLITTIRKILILMVLFFIYIFGFGLTLFFVAIFNRRVLRTLEKGQNTFWKQAQGYNTDIEECLRES